MYGKPFEDHMKESMPEFTIRNLKAELASCEREITSLKEYQKYLEQRCVDLANTNRENEKSLEVGKDAVKFVVLLKKLLVDTGKS